MANTRTTFWSLLSDNSIHIPLLQRDYAFGREDKKAENVRETLISDLHGALSEKGTRKVDFDFIYGSTEDGVFYPIDGQQRLTTLFLLHWYLAICDGQIAEVYSTLQKFSYQTRPSSKAFCSYLTSENFCSNLGINTFIDQQKLSALITNQPWYRPQWKLDPTISGMIKMLDSIHEVFKGKSGFFQYLVSNQVNLPVSFQIFDLKNHGLDDMLYIKMNARGLSLNIFEKFKAKFENHVRGLDDTFDGLDVFLGKMDNEWTEFFWSHRNEDFSADTAFMSVIHAITIFRHCQIENSDNGNIGKLHDLKVSEIADYEIIPECFDLDGIDYLIKFLDMLCLNVKIFETVKRPRFQESIDSDSLKSVNLFKELLHGTLDYRERTQIYAISAFLIKNSDNKVDFDNYLRVVLNLTINSSINGGNFKNCCVIFQLLVDSGLPILKALNQVEINGFLPYQVEEEKLKAKLMLKSEDWLNAILKAESHGYFNGQIGFLFAFIELVKVDQLKDADLTELNDYLGEFNRYYESICRVFDEQGLRSELTDFVWERALLSKGDYLLGFEPKFSFCVNDIQRVSWKSLCRHKNLKIVKLLLDALTDNPSINNLLKSIIESALLNNEIEPWRKIFIREPKMLKYFEEPHGDLRASRFIIFNNNGNYIRILYHSDFRSRNVEAYSYAIYLILERSGKDVGKDVGYTQWIDDGPKFVNKINGKECKLSYIESEYGWKYVLEYKTAKLFLDSEQAVFNELVAQNIIDASVDYCPDAPYFLGQSPT